MHLIAEAESSRLRTAITTSATLISCRCLTLLDSITRARSQLINPNAAMPRPAPGTPPGVQRQAIGLDSTLESVGTSHFSVVDAEGNAVSMTTTIESAFGSRVLAAGFLLNNELTDFSFLSEDAEGRSVANAVAPGKRPRSSMAPTIVFDEAGRVKAVLGSPGGSRIILYVVGAHRPHRLGARCAGCCGARQLRQSRGAFEIEYDPATDWRALIRPWLSTPSLWQAMRVKPFGHEIAPDLLTSGLHIIVVPRWPRRRG